MFLTGIAEHVAQRRQLIVYGLLGFSIILNPIVAVIRNMIRGDFIDRGPTANECNECATAEGIPGGRAGRHCIVTACGADRLYPGLTNDFYGGCRLGALRLHADGHSNFMQMLLKLRPGSNCYGDLRLGDRHVEDDRREVGVANSAGRRIWLVYSFRVNCFDLPSRS